MKLFLIGFSQKNALEIRNTNQKLDIIDLVILDWLKCFYPKMKKCFIGEKEYVWIEYQKVLDDIPILDIKKRTVMGRFKKMSELGVLEHTTVYEKDGRKGTYSYFRLADKYFSLLSDENKNDSQGENEYDSVRSNEQGCPSKRTGGVRSNEQGVCVQTNTKDNTLYDCSVNNSSKKNKKTEFDILIDEYTCNDKLKESIYEFIKMRKTNKKSLTSYGLKKILNKLDRLATNDDEKIQILDNSIERSWAGVFELKEEEKKQQSPKPEVDVSSMTFEELEEYQANGGTW